MLLIAPIKEFTLLNADSAIDFGFLISGRGRPLKSTPTSDLEIIDLTPDLKSFLASIATWGS
jgi:hypothetical protein